MLYKGLWERNYLILYEIEFFFWYKTYKNYFIEDFLNIFYLKGSKIYL